MKLLLAWLACGAMAAAQIHLEDTIPVRFGDPIQDVAQRLKERPFDTDRGRQGVDRMLATTAAQLWFDSGRLWRVMLHDRHRLSTPLVAFGDAWKNFDPIGELKPVWWMSQYEFDEYFAAWKARAVRLGKQENVDYWIKQSAPPSARKELTVMFGPRRKLWGTGEFTGDTWAFRFRAEEESKINPRWEAGQLVEMTITDDRFGTQRRAPLQPAVPAPRTNGRALAAEGVRGAKVTLDDGRTVEFGQPLEEAEKIFGPSKEGGMAAVMKRPGVEREIEMPTVKLEFDRGRLKGIGFTEGYRFVHPVQVFDEPWKNPDPIERAAITGGITRTQFDAYLEAWKKRAAAAGKKEWIDYDISRSNEPNWSSVYISLAPERLTSNGRGVWSDGWSVTFNPEQEGGGLSQLGVLLDAYNSLARPPPGAPDPTLTGARFEDGTEVYFGQVRGEVEALIGAAATLATSPTSTVEIRSMLLPSLWLTFDADRLARIGYRHTSEAPAPFRQLWKNFTPIGEQHVTIGMTKVAFWEYLEAWERRAESGRLQKDRDYRVRATTSERTDALIISMRGARGWDSWVVSFTAKARPQTVISIDASCAEFRSRPPAPSAEALQAMQKAKQKGKTGPQVDVSAMTAPEIGLPPVELPKLELKLP